MRPKALIVPGSILAIILSMMLISCWEGIDELDKMEKIELGPWVDFPLVSSTFNAEEFLTEGESKAKIVDQSGLLVLVFDDSISTPRGTNFFSLPNQQSPMLTINGPEVTFPSPGGSVTLTKNITFSFNPQAGESLDSVWVTAGQMVIQAISNFPANVALTFSVPIFEKAGVGLQQNFTLNGGGNQVQNISLQGYTFDLTLNGTGTNQVSFAITAVITDTGQPMGPGNQLRLSFNLNSLRFRALFGQLGTRSFTIGTDSLHFDIFNSITAKNFELQSPLISLTVKNSFGLPVGFNIQTFAGIKANGTVVPLSGPALNPPLNPYQFTAPGITQIGQSTTSNITLSGTNSNLGALIGALPNEVIYRFNAQLNPGGAVTKNFVLDTSRVKVDVHAELPFHGKIEALSMSKRYDFDGLSIDGVDESYVKVRTVNEFPMDANVQVYFVNAAGLTLDSLFTNATVVKAAPVDATGFTSGSTELISTVFVNQAKIDRIDNADHLVIRATISTTNNGAVPVKFSVTDKVAVAIGVHTRIRYQLN